MCNYRNHIYATDSDFSCDIRFDGDRDTALIVLISQHHPKAEIIHEWHSDVYGGLCGKTKWLHGEPVEDMYNDCFDDMLDDMYF